MAGNRNSGRKSKFEEIKVLEIIELSMRTLKEFFNSPNITLRDKGMVAKDFILKKIPTKVQGEGFDQVIKNVIVFRNPEALKEDGTNRIKDTELQTR